MSLFDKLKSARDIAKESIVEIPWNILNEAKQLETIVKESEEVPVLIFKHSTRCEISKRILKNFEENYKLSTNQLKLYYLDLWEFRPISDTIEKQFGVLHESPQVLIIQNGKSIYDASHFDVDYEVIKELIA